MNVDFGGFLIFQLNLRLDGRVSFPVPNQWHPFDGAKGPHGGNHAHSFEEIGFALPIGAAEKLPATFKC